MAGKDYGLSAERGLTKSEATDINGERLVEETPLKEAEEVCTKRKASLVQDGIAAQKSTQGNLDRNQEKCP